MKFRETSIRGAYVVEPEPHHDERGFFARTYCAREFAERGLEPVASQCNVSFNTTRGTLRGLHSQRPPHEEIKLVRCTRGAIYDVLLDLRRDSPSYRVHQGIELTFSNRLALYVPKGVYHGFLTLEDDSEVFYQMSELYVPGEGAGVRWNDPAFGIEWPAEVRVISPRDATYPDFRDRSGG
jgi:dTDP-4-dehydrorhamnose 3,5-epimerase